jgi:hypothetical protein
MQFGWKSRDDWINKNGECQAIPGSGINHDTKVHSGEPNRASEMKSPCLADHFIRFVKRLPMTTDPTRRTHSSHGFSTSSLGDSPKAVRSNGIWYWQVTGNRSGGYSSSPNLLLVRTCSCQSTEAAHARVSQLGGLSLFMTQSVRYSRIRPNAKRMMMFT